MTTQELLALATRFHRDPGSLTNEELLRLDRELDLDRADVLDLTIKLVPLGGWWSIRQNLEDLMGFRGLYQPEKPLGRKSLAQMSPSELAEIAFQDYPQFQ